MSPSSRGLGLEAFNLSTGVRISLGTPKKSSIASWFADWLFLWEKHRVVWWCVFVRGEVWNDRTFFWLWIVMDDWLRFLG